MQKQRAKIMEKVNGSRDHILDLPILRLSTFITSYFIYAYSPSTHDVYWNLSSSPFLPFQLHQSSARHLNLLIGFTYVASLLYHYPDHYQGSPRAARHH